MEAQQLTREQEDLIRKYMDRYFQEHPPRDLVFSAKDVEQRERIIRVEESIETQIKLTRQLMEQVDKRFEQIDKRFEQIDKRFEQMQQAMDKRFEQVDKRFEQMQQAMDKRFEQVDKRFEQMQQAIDKRFDIVQRQLYWLFTMMGGVMLTTLGALITLIVK